MSDYKDPYTKEMKEEFAKMIGEELDFYDYKKTAAKLRKWHEEKQLDQYPFLCSTHAPKDYPNIAEDIFDHEGKMIKNYLCTKCHPRKD